MRRLLIIEDSTLSAFLYKRAVETQDPHFQVHVANTLARGQEEWLRFQPDIVLCDIHLPDSDGEPTLPQLARFKPSKIIAMSADPSLAGAALEAGADDFMAKAAGDSGPLLARINALLPCQPSSH